MTFMSAVRDQLQKNAAEAGTSTKVMTALSQALVDAGGSVNDLRDALVPNGWCFVLTNSGTRIDVARRSALQKQCQRRLKRLSKWRGLARKESMHEAIVAEIYKTKAIYAEVNQYLMRSQGVQDVDAAINAVFRGTGAEFDGRAFGFTRSSARRLSRQRIAARTTIAPSDVAFPD